MRHRLLYSSIILFIASIGFGQAPYAFNYQGVARDAEGAPLAEQEISLLIEIVRGFEEGITEYGEEHKVTTNENGHFSIRVGLGDQFIGNLRNIDWSVDKYYIRTEMDPKGGDDYIELGSSQLYSVPFALYAASSGSESEGNTDEQTLTLTDNTLSIENGNMVDLSGLGGGESLWQSDGAQGIYYDGPVDIYSIAEDINIALGENSVGTGLLQIYGEDQKVNISFNSLLENQNHGIISLFDELSTTKLNAYVSNDNSGRMWLSGDNGNSNIFLASLADDPNSGFLGIYNNNGDANVRAFTNPNGQGFVGAYGSNGNINASLTWLSGSSNNGYVGAFDSKGTEQAAMYVNSAGNGVIFADIKNFRMDHPTSENHDIVYASLEGPEAAAYIRGTATIQGGKATILFPEHFKHVLSSKKGMTVMITPLSADSKGLAVISKSHEGFVVQELNKGTGSYQIDWEVKGVRAGHENFQVVQAKPLSGRELSIPNPQKIEIPKK